MTNISGSLKDLVVPIDAPTPHPDNPRLGNIEAIQESLQRFGQVRPILVQRSTGYIIAGNHTFRAAKELGWDGIACVQVDLDDTEASSYLLADNRLADLGTYENEILAKLAEKLMLAGKLQGTGYTPDDVDDLLALQDALPEVDPGETEADYGASDEEIAERFRNRSQGGPLRQFVFHYEQEVGKEVEGMLVRLARAWGMSGARDVVLEALRRASADPPVEGLTPEEKVLADTLPEPDDTPAGVEIGAEEDGTTGIPTGNGDPYRPTTGQTPLEAAGLVSPPTADTPAQPATLAEQREQES